MADDYATYNATNSGLASPAYGHETVSGTTSVVTLAHTSRALWIGGTGNVSVNLVSSTANPATFTSVPAGTILPIRVTGFTTLTTATNIISLY
jgi:hypothetical protein